MTRRGAFLTQWRNGCTKPGSMGFRFGRSVQRVIAAFVFVAAAATGAHAQAAATPPASHSGFWVGFGAGVAHAHLDCGQCGPLLTDDPWRGGTGFGLFVAMGTTLSRQLLIGGEVSLYGKRNGSEQRDASVGTVSAVLRYYPVTKSRLYLQGGGGLGFSTLAGGPGLIESGGWALQAGLGYDIRSGGRFTFTPYGQFVQVFSDGGVGDNRGSPARGPRNPFYVQVGIGLHWY